MYHTFKNLVIFADGGCRGNPGTGGSGFVIQEVNSPMVVENMSLTSSETATTLYQAGIFLGPNSTNNIAEWKSLLLALQTIVDKNLEYKNLQIIMDSKLVVNQIQDKWKVKQAHLQKLYEQTKANLSKLKIQPEFHHVLREYNSLADKMVNFCLDSKEDMIEDYLK